jgi:hypothetical protein
MFVPIELFDALATSIARVPFPVPMGVAAVELDDTHYAAIYTGKEGLRLASRQGSPVCVADFLTAPSVPLDTLPVTIRAKLDDALRVQRGRFLVVLAGQMSPIDVDSAPVA